MSKIRLFLFFTASTSHSFFLNSKCTRNLILKLDLNYWFFNHSQYLGYCIHSNHLNYKPPGVPGVCQKMCLHPLNLNLEIWYANMEPKLNKLRKIIKIEVFLSNFPEAMFIQGATFIPDSRVDKSNQSLGQLGIKGAVLVLEPTTVQ